MHEVLLFTYAEILNPNKLLGGICIGGLYLGVALIAARLVRVWSGKLSEHPNLFIDKTTANFIGQLLRLGCFLVAATFYAHTVPALNKVGTALLASAGVLSIILGLAAQNTLGNLIAGIALLFYRPFGIGDILVMSTPAGQETGTVHEFTLGYTKLLTKDGRWIIAPNSIVISSVLIRVK